MEKFKAGDKFVIKRHKNWVSTILDGDGKFLFYGIGTVVRFIGYSNIYDDHAYKVKFDNRKLFGIIKLKDVEKTFWEEFMDYDKKTKKLKEIIREKNRLKYIDIDPYGEENWEE